MPLTCLALNGTLKPSPEPSSTDAMIDLVFDRLGEHGVATDRIRLVDHDVKPGVLSDMGAGDAWPAIRERIVKADILLFATPIWLGQPSSVTKRALERMDAFLGETDDKARMPATSKVAIVAVVGNEDGAHHVAAELFQALNDVGFTLPAAGSVYWVGEAMGSINFADLDKTPDKVASTAATLASNAVHLARLLTEQPYPGVPG